MAKLVGVCEAGLIQTPGTLKRAALLFDQISLAGVEAIRYLEKRISHEELTRSLAELDWLVEQEVAVIAPPHISQSFQLKSGRHLSVDDVLEMLLSITLTHPEEAKKIFGERFANLVDAEGESPEKLKEVIAKNHVVAAGNIVRAAAVRLKEANGWDTVALGIEGPRTQGVFTPGPDSVMSVLLNEFPQPDDSTPWEAIVDFRNDPDLRGKFYRLKNWFNIVIAEERPPSQVEDELRESIFEYDQYMKMHRIKTRSGSIETIISTVAEVAEHTLKIKWGDAARALFKIRQQHVALYEAEREAPGRHVAYILDATQRFSRPTQ